MRKIAMNFTMILLAFVMLTGFAMGASISTVTFEAATGYTTSIAEFTDTGTDYFTRTDGSNIANESFTNVQGSYYFAAQDIDGEGATLPVTLTIQNVDISGYTSLGLNVYLAEDDASDANEDWDAADYVHIDYDIDGGGYNNAIHIESTGGTNTAPAIDTNFDGTGDGTTLTSAFAQFTKSLTGTGDSLDIKITFNLNSGDEDIAIDNIEVTGTAAGGIADPTSFDAAVASDTQLNLTWTDNASGDEVMVVYDADGSFDDPEDGTGYTGSALGGTVIYQGTDEAYNHTSLSANTAYYYKAWSVDGSDNYSEGVTVNATTAKAEPAAHVTSFAATSDYNSVSFTWTDATADGYMIKASTTSLVAITDPVDGTDEADDEDLSDGSGVVSVPQGDQVFDWNGLDAETTYYFKIYPFNNTGSLINYKTDGSVPSETQATTAAPAAPSLIISEVADPGDDYAGRFVEIFNTSTSTIDFSSTTVYFARQANGGSWASIQLTGTLASETALVIGSASSIDATYGASTCDVNFTSVTGNGDDGYFLYMDGDQSSGSLFDAYGVVDEDGSGMTWEYTDSRAVRKSSVNTPNATWTASEWTIASADVADMNPGTHSVDSPTPITLTSFTAKAKNGKVELAWETASEVNNARFVIYRNGAAIASVEGAGTTSELSNYSYVDAEVVPGVTYTYVLADVDYANVETKYLDEAVSVTIANDIIEADFVVNAAYPNPFNPSVAVSYQLSANSLVKAAIYNTNGSVVEELLNSNMSAGSHELVWNASGMPSGVYILKMLSGDVINTQKLVLMK